MEKVTRVHRLIHHARRLHHHVKHHAKHWFIPHPGNDHRPHALRPPALRVYSISLIAVKVFVTGFLFLLYPSNGQFAAITANEILALTNESRSAQGLPTLTLNATLNRAASLKAQDMVANNYFAHTSPAGVKPWEFFKRGGYSYSAAGENLAIDFTEAGTVHTAFMNSSSHAANILNEKYTEMGVAVTSGVIEGRETTILVEFFAKPYQKAAVATQPTTTQPQPTTQTPPATPTVKPQATPPPAPVTYTAKLASQSDLSLSIKTNETVHVWTEFTNTGTATWTNDGEHFIALNATNPAGRTSQFMDASWKSAFRPAVLDQSRVASGERGRFSFALHSPSTAGTYQEDFGVVAENLTWLSGGTVSIPITVVETAQPEETPTSAQVVGATSGPTEPTPTDTPPITQPTAEAPSSETPTVQIETYREPATTQILQAENDASDHPGTVGNIIDFSNRFFAIILAFIACALITTIVVEMRIHHPRLVIQSIVVLLLTTGAIIYKPHFLEGITRVLNIQ